ncbi:MAG: 30S ribosomal protein S6 [Bdellovibrionaceae bacterium]|jgi:small subunit ribosomal protein S6|nr:30S ribosomal protein S6 [Pseudobdellovibrionaceae bacterium]
MDFAKLPRKADQLNSYEVVVILDADATLDQQKAIFQRNKSIIESYGGRVHSLDTWGRRQLANPIEKKQQGIYFHMMFQAKPAAITELERVMRISDQVMRFMHVKLDARIPMEKHEEKFKMALRETAEREKEREAKAQARRNAAATMDA